MKMPILPSRHDLPRHRILATAILATLLQSHPVPAATQHSAVSGASTTGYTAGAQTTAGTGTTSSDSQDAGFGGTAIPSQDPYDNATDFLTYPDAAPLEITINGIAGLAQEVIPSLAEPSLVFYPDAYFWNDHAVSCLRIDVGAKDTYINAPVHPDTVTGYFGNNGKVFVDVDLNASMSTTFFWDVETAPGFTFCDLIGAMDNVADWLVGIIGGHGGGSQTPDDISYEELTVSASGLVADVDLTLGLVGDTVKVTDIDQLNVAIGEIDYNGTALVELITRLADAGVSLVYDDITDFLNEQLNENVIPDQEPRLKHMINTAIQQNLTVDQAIDLGPYAASIHVEPTQLLSSRSANTMTLGLGFDITSSAPTAPGAENLGFYTSPNGAPPSTSADFDLQIPHWVLAKAIYEAGRQGLFCQSALMPLSSTPWIVQPNGSLSVKNGFYYTTETTESGFPVGVGHHAGELVLTVPLEFSGKVGGYDGSATGDLKVYFKLAIPEGDRSVYIAATEVAVENVVGTLTTEAGVPVDMSQVLDTFLNAAADNLANSLAAIPILPRVTAFSDDLGLEIAQVSINDAYTTLGIDIVKLPDPEDDSGGFDLPQAHINDGPHLDEDDLPEITDEIRDHQDPVP